jgi:hypothetical protein
MAILIDPPVWPALGRRWCHLISDASLRELHAFAARLAVPERAFEGDHYDLPEERYAQAVRAGAIPVSSRELLRRLQACGLRRSKRRGERVVASRHDEVLGHRIDSVLSPLPPPGRVRLVHVVVLHAGRLLAIEDGEGFRLPAVDVPEPGQVLVAARQLAGALLGPPWAGAPARQVGYLRRVPDGRARPLDVEVVLRWPDADPPPRDPRLVVALPPAAVGPAAETGAPAVAGAAMNETAAGAVAAEQDEVLRWVPVRQAFPLLPVDLAPVALNEYHRLRPPGPEEPGPLRPAGR